MVDIADDDEYMVDVELEDVDELESSLRQTQTRVGERKQQTLGRLLKPRREKNKPQGGIGGKLYGWSQSLPKEIRRMIMTRYLSDLKDKVALGSVNRKWRKTLKREKAVGQQVRAARSVWREQKRAEREAEEREARRLERDRERRREERLDRLRCVECRASCSDWCDDCRYNCSDCCDSLCDNGILVCCGVFWTIVLIAFLAVGAWLVALSASQPLDPKGMSWEKPVDVTCRVSEARVVTSFCRDWRNRDDYVKEDAWRAEFKVEVIRPNLQTDAMAVVGLGADGFDCEYEPRLKQESYSISLTNTYKPSTTAYPCVVEANEDVKLYEDSTSYSSDEPAVLNVTVKQLNAAYPVAWYSTVGWTLLITSLSLSFSLILPLGIACCIECCDDY